jgi:predicted SnoaL-like aldol condensation-catalyzing enzyme
MGTEENKAVVRRFMNEVIAGGNLDVADEVLAPNYVNLSMGGTDLAGIKAMVTATSAAVREQRFDDEELVADGDAVFARFNYVITLPDGSTTTARTLAYYCLADDRIVVNDVMFDSDLMQVLGPLMSSPPGAES